ncbi:fibronectin type III domain-containing protein [Streptomyces cirratus]
MRIPARRPGRTAAALSLCLALAACSGSGPQSPPAPAGITAQAGSATSVHVMWEAPSGGTAVTGYSCSRPTGLIRDVPAEKTMVDVTGLSPLTAYAFTVRAKGADAAARPTVRPPGSPPGRPGGGPPGTHRPGHHHRPRRRPPGRPPDLGAGERRHGRDGLRRLPGRCPDPHGGPGETSTTLTGLQPGTRYGFTVRARDGSDNASPDGPLAEVTTPADPAQGPDTAPSGFTAVASRAPSPCPGPLPPPGTRPPSTSSTSTDSPSPSSSSGPARFPVERWCTG